jgi:predicted phosphodiesterase
VRFGLISDIHGNLLALDAVLADGAAQGVDRWWVLGDLAAIGPEPVATLERLANLRDACFVRGNTDRYVVTGARPWPYASDVEREPSLQTLFDTVEASFSWTTDALTRAGWSDWVRALPAEQRATLPDGTTMLGVHASPSSDDGDGITPYVDDDDLATMLAPSGAQIVCAGHTHVPTDRVVGPVRAVNLGSVSNPITSDLRASYVVVDADRHGPRLAHRRVAYDHDAVLTRIRSTEHPDADFVASFQRGEQVRYPASSA